MVQDRSPNSVVGIIFPILPNHVKRFFEGRKRVFVKFFGAGVLPKELQCGSRLFFYKSRNNKEVVGEARIVEVCSGTVEEVLTRFGDGLFLTRTELEEYAGNRRTKQMLALVLEEPKRYEVPTRLDKSVTMAGLYMTKTMLKKLRTSK